MSYLTKSPEEMGAKVWRTLNACSGLSVDETTIHIQNTVNKMQRKRVKRVKNRLLKLENEKKLRDRIHIHSGMGEDSKTYMMVK